MTYEQLEELLGTVVKIKAAETYEKVMNAFPGPPIVEYLCRENANLTRRVTAAEKLADLLEMRSATGSKEWCDLRDEYLTAYREASK